MGAGVTDAAEDVLGAAVIDAAEDVLGTGVQRTSSPVQRIGCLVAFDCNQQKVAANCKDKLLN